MEQQRSAAAPAGERRHRRRPGENRERLLNAGIVEFGLHGFHGASTTAIAARADVPQPHVYANFQTKRELFLGCVARASEQLAGGGPEAPAPSTAGAASGAVAEPARLLLQAVAALGDDELEPELRAGISALRALLGAPAFERLLLLGAAALLER